MHTHSLSRLLLAVLVAGLALAAFILAGAAAWGVALSPLLALAALAASGLVVQGAVWLRDEVRTARWDAGQRLR
jgi:hypothetical protein